jgi:hypothetical protein
MEMCVLLRLDSCPNQLSSILTCKHGFKNGAGRNPGLRAEQWFGKLFATSASEQTLKGASVLQLFGGASTTLSFDSSALF